MEWIESQIGCVIESQERLGAWGLHLVGFKCQTEKLES